MSASPTTTSWNQQRRTLIPATVVGTILEWYDMFVYAQAASLIFATIFFPSFSGTAGTLAALATFGAGYIARPLGAIVFGHIGDRFGRKTALSLTLIMMGVCSTLIGLLPMGMADPWRFGALDAFGGLRQCVWCGVLLAVVFFVPNSQTLIGRFESALRSRGVKSGQWAWCVTGFACTLVFVVAAINDSRGVSEFIYFNF